MDVIGTDEFIEWYERLDDAAREDVAVVVDLLDLRGVSLGFPHSSDIRGSSENLRELRIQSRGR